LLTEEDIAQESEMSVAYNVSEMIKFHLQKKSTEVHFIPH